MSNYANGATIERSVRDELYACGASVVIRSAGSKGVLDLVAFLHGRTIGVQVKRLCWPPPAERRALAALEQLTGWEAWVVRWEPRKPNRWARVLVDSTLSENVVGTASR